MQGGLYRPDDEAEHAPPPERAEQPEHDNGGRPSIDQGDYAASDSTRVQRPVTSLASRVDALLAQVDDDDDLEHDQTGVRPAPVPPWLEGVRARTGDDVELGPAGGEALNEVTRVGSRSSPRWSGDGEEAAIEIAAASPLPASPPVAAEPIGDDDLDEVSVETEPVGDDDLDELSVETEPVEPVVPRTVTVSTAAPPPPRHPTQPIPPIPPRGQSQPIPAPPPIPRAPTSRPTVTISVPPIPTSGTGATGPVPVVSAGPPPMPPGATPGEARPTTGRMARLDAPRGRPASTPPEPPVGMGVFDGLDDREALDVEPEASRPEAFPVPGEPADAGDDELREDVPSLVPTLESQLESPTAIERAVAGAGEAALERRAEELQRDLDAATDKPVIAGLAYELGELFERRLEDEARAVKAYGRALQSDPSLRPNLWAIRRVFYRRGLWPNLIKLIDAEVRFARSDTERADLLTEKGLVLAERLIQTGDARTAYLQAAGLDPTAILPLLQVERIADADGDLATLADVWARLAAASRRPERRLVYLLDLVRLHADQGPEGQERARELIAEAVALGVDGERVATERLRLAEQVGDTEEILAALEAQAALALAQFGPAGAPAGDAGAGQGRTSGAPLDRATALRLRLVALRRRQAQVARAAAPSGEGGSGDRAWDYLQQALALAPGEPVLLADLADLAEELGRYGELAELVESWQALEGDPARALTLSLRRADALLRGGKREQARSLLTSLEASAPGFAAITALLERDALAAGDATTLARAYGSAAEAARLGTAFGPGVTSTPSVAGAAALYVAAAEIWAHEVGGEVGDTEARAALGQALEVAPGHPAAREALVELHERAGRIDEAAQLLEEQSQQGEIAGRLSALERLARLHREHARLEEALSAERRLAELDPDDVRLGWRVDATLADLGLDAERVDHLVALAGRDADAARRGLALATAARLAEGMGQRDRALELYRATLGVWPDDRHAREAVIELLRDAGRWDELVAERRAEAAGLTGRGDEAGAVRALREAAWVLEHRLGRHADAAGAWREVLDRSATDSAALAGLVRTAAAAGDDDGLVAALERTLEAGPDGDQAALAAVRLGAAHELAGRSDDAADAYRRVLAAGGETVRSVAALTAATALLDLASEAGDTGARVEASAELARRTGDTALAAALHEDTGWLYALILEDFDRAAEAFTAAAAADPARPGPLLGVALVAARRNEQTELASAYERLAAATSMPDAAAAMRLRSAAIAAAAGDADVATARVAAARSAAPDDVGALVVAAEYAPPPTAPGRGDDSAAAIDQLLARAEVLEMRAALADDPAARVSWELDRAEALEAAGRLKESGAVVAAVLRAQPDDLRALESLRRLARRGGDRPTWARATLALARGVGDRPAKLALLREAASIFDPALPRTGEFAPVKPGNGIHDAPTRPMAEQADALARADGDVAPSGGYGADPAAAVAVYRRILVEDPSAPEFTRMCTLYRQHGDIRGLALAIADRLAWIDAGGTEPAVGVPLLLERARLRSAIGDSRGAAADLEDLVRRDPAHTEALSLLADTALALGDAGRAADLWKRYLAAETVPERRADAELTLSRILAENMDDVAGAIEQLERVVATQPHDLPLREKLVGLCTRVQDWTRVARELREISRLRPTPGEKAREELRLAEILRDKLGDRGAARAALERARGLDPLQLDAVQGLAEVQTDRGQRAAVLTAAAADQRAAQAQSPARAALYERLATIAGWLGDDDARWLALVALEAVGSPSAEQKVLITAGRTRMAPLPRQPLTRDQRAMLEPIAAGGVATELWRTIAPAVTAAVGVDPAKLGFTRADKIAFKALGKKHDALAAVLATFGVTDAEIYVAEGRAGVARALSGETPIVCLGADVVAAAETAREARFQLGRVALLAAEGTGTLAELREAEVGWYFAAALLAAEVRLPPVLAEIAAAEQVAVGERAKLLAKHLARRDKKTLGQLGPRVAELGDPVAWRRAALAASHRAGLVLAGDLSVALGLLDVGRGARAVADSPAALDLLAWSASAAHADLRRALGASKGSSR